MTKKSWPVLLIGFNLLLILMFVSSLTATRKNQEIHEDMLRNQELYRQNDRTLEEIRSGMFLSSLLIRDFLVDWLAANAADYKQQLLRIKSDMEAQVDRLRKLTREEDREGFERLEAELAAYWDTIDPIFQWTLQEKQERSARFLRQELRGRRTAVVSIAQEISKLNAGAIAQQDEAYQRSRTKMDHDLRWLMAATLLVGVLIVAGTVIRVWKLEKRTDQQHKRTEEAERVMRDLSHQLVRAQEDERRTLSRELHDEVGQLLTALRMELQNLEQLHGIDEVAFREHLEEGKRLSARSLAIVRDLAMGLRPSMLDDLGLAPAIQWQARDFSRRTGIAVNVQIDGQFEDLPDAHRTCVYRVVQEALTNCARHARASNIRILLHGAPEGLHLTVQDDGAGMDASKRTGMGLIGIEERVREPNGSLRLHSKPEKGTVVSVEIPLAREVAL